jgi:hypothetical protein
VFLFRDPNVVPKLVRKTVEPLERRIIRRRTKTGLGAHAGIPTTSEQARDVAIEGDFEGVEEEKKQNQLVTTFTALSRQNSQIAETPLMQMNRINAIDAYVLY